MEKHASNLINYLRIPKAQIELLGHVRHWKNLKIGYEEDFIWIKDITDEQLQSVAIQRIPGWVCYYENDHKLSLKGHLLPSCSIPTVLWTPIQRALGLQLPTLNHHYFGTSEKISLELIPSSKEQEAYAILSDLEDLGAFIESSAAVRLKPLKWTIVAQNKSLVFGTPILPIQGEVYWRWNRFLIPAGYDFNFSSLAQSLHQAIDPGHKNWILWSIENHYYTIDSKYIQALSLSSYRNTLSNF